MCLSYPTHAGVHDMDDTSVTVAVNMVRSAVSAGFSV